jgi:hypothetical protein
MVAARVEVPYPLWLLNQFGMLFVALDIEHCQRNKLDIVV